MTVVRHFPTFTAARTNLRALLDAAGQGLVTTLQRDHHPFVVVLASELAEDLRRLRPAGTMVVAEGGGWAAMLPYVPVHGDAETFDGAVEDLAEGLREYAEDWNERLHSAPNHVQHRTLVRIVELSGDQELRRWLLGDDGSDEDAASGVPSVTTA